nr:ParM/StbA family protein [uncultured Cellulosilyticum sp.]
MNKSKKIGIDMGNSTISVSGLINEAVKQAYTNSVYTLDTALITGDVVESKGVKLSLGTGQITLTNVDKTNRELIEHQILWAVNSIYGVGTHYVSMCVGLPISIYKAKKTEYEEMLKSLGTITGKVNGLDISVSLTKIKVMAEGHASIKPLANYINKNNTTLLIDIGMKTTDILLISHDGKKFTVDKYATINIALYDIYQVMREAIAQQGVEVTIEYIDKRFKSDTPVIRTEQGDYNLVDHLKDAAHVCRDIMKAIENEFGKTVLHDKVFTGGGAERFLAAIDGKIKNNIDVPTKLRYYSNSLGYLLGLK